MMPAWSRSARRVAPLLLVLLLLPRSSRAAKGGTECVVCGIVAGLLLEKSKDPAAAVARLVPEGRNPEGLNPDSLCALVGLCDASCKLFPTQWPVTPPPAPPRACRPPCCSGGTPAGKRRS